MMSVKDLLKRDNSLADRKKKRYNDTSKIFKFRRSK
jgi:hypothetical protein